MHRVCASSLCLLGLFLGLKVSGVAEEWAVLTPFGSAVRCHNIAAVWVAFSPSGLHSSQGSSDMVVDR